MNAARRLRLLQHVALMEMKEENAEDTGGKPWISRWELLGQYDTLMRELREEDPEAFVNYMRLPMELYDEARITTCITKQDTWWRQALDSGLKFACTMRHLSSGEGYNSINQLISELG